jgi:phage shock protein PspC (stress-responsive transcriptional regulator)
MKKLFLTTNLALLRLITLGCPACQLQQPKILRGITHGTGPQHQWDMLIVWVAVVVVLFTLFYSIKWLIRPGEQGKNHIKRFILNEG